MRGFFATSALCAAAAFGGATLADDAEVMAHYSAYNAAFDAGRFEDAMKEGEAAWRAAERAWGARDETAVLAFNLARLDLLRGKRAAAIEPAERTLALVSQSVAKSVPREEAAMLAAYAKLPAEKPGKEQTDALSQALAAFTPGEDPVGRRVDADAWRVLVNVRVEQGQLRAAYVEADRATLLLQRESAEPRLIGVIAILGARSAFRLEELAGAVAVVHRGIAAFPAQPPERPVDDVLGALLGWDAGLHSAINERKRDSIAKPEEKRDLGPEPEAWKAGRTPSAMGCKVEWIAQSLPDYPAKAAYNGEFIAMMFEYYLDADGSVARVEPMVKIEGDPGFAKAVVASLRRWRASPQPRAECRGPWTLKVDFRVEP
jgi:hypothetical protein